MADQLKDPAAVGLWKSVIDKYSDNAHFVYELLQNADDAEATCVKVYLGADVLEFVHNGKVLFSLSDPDKEGDKSSSGIGHINAITSIGSSTKVEGNKIGKFGVGFKSVFKYTDQPHIEDDNYSFDIVDYIVPQTTHRVSAHRANGETSFFFPIKESKLNMPIIRDKFISLINPLLFLVSLSKILIYENNELIFFYDKACKDSWRADDVNCSFIETKTPKADTYFYLHSTLVENHSIANAFYSNEDGELDVIHNDDPAYCFFPTKEHLNLNHIVHAPFLLTESRENIKMNEQWNDLLFRQLGLLFVKSIVSLTKRKTLQGMPVVGDNVFCLFPIVSAENPFVRLFKSSMKGYLNNAPIFLLADGSYENASHIVFTREKELTSLFVKEDLWILLPKTNGMRWGLTSLCSVEESEQKPILSFLKEFACLNQTLSTLDILKSISSSFLQAKGIVWLQKFYAYLSHKKTLWLEHMQDLKLVPLFLCEDGSFRPAYASSEDTHPSIYLSSGCDSHFVAIEPQLVQHSQSRRFFENVGIKDPGALAEILEYILPAYEAGQVDYADDEMVSRHLNFISDYFNTLFPFSQERLDFLSAIQNVPFLPVVNCLGMTMFKPVGECYMRNSLLNSFLQDDETIFFFENKTVEKYILPERRDDFYSFLSFAGLNYRLKVEKVNREPSSIVLKELDLHPVSLRQVDKGAQVIEDKIIVGADNFIRNITKERSAAFFKLLSEEIKDKTSFMFRSALEGSYQYVEKGKRSVTTETIRQTSAINFIFHSKWLYAKDGRLCSVNEIEETQQLDLLYDFTTPDLLFFLNIRISDDLKNLTQDQREAVNLVNRFKAKGLSVSEMEKILEHHIDRTNAVE